MVRDRVLPTAVGFLAVASVFAALFWFVDAAAVVDAVRGADPGLLAVVAATVLLWNVAWGLALHQVLRALDVGASLRDAVLVHAAAAFANHVTPFGQAGGEPVTAWLLTRTTDVEYEVGLASVASLDAVNVVPSAPLAVTGAAYFAATTEFGAVPTLGPVGVAVVVGAPAAGLVAWRYRRAADRRLHAAAGGAARAVARVVPVVTPPNRAAVVARVAGFVDAVGRVAASRRRLAAAVGCSALGWGLQAVGLWVTFLALDATIPPYLPFLVLPLGTLGSVVPTPGGLGGTEAINVTLLVLATGVDAAVVAAAVTLHSVGGYLLTTAVGAGATGVLGVRGAQR